MKPDAVCECGGHVGLANQPQRHPVFEVTHRRAQVDEYRRNLRPLQGLRQASFWRAAGLACPMANWGRALSLVGVPATRYHLVLRKIRNLLYRLNHISHQLARTE